MNSLKNDVKTIMENQKHVIAEILGMKTRIEALERLDFNKNVTIDIVVADLVNQKRIIHNKLVQVDESINNLNDKLQKSEKIEAKKVDDDKHVEKQAKRLQCTYCDDVFSENWKIELHLRSHEESEQFQCNVCNKTFQAEWRMKKHIRNHYRKNIKKCKFFQEGQSCPFQEVGCKFSHDSLAHKHINENNVEEETNTEMCLDLADHEIEKDTHEESLEDLMRKAKSFENEDDDLETIDVHDNDDEETIDAIMAKARAFKVEDESESLNCILVKAIDRNPGR